MYVGGRLGVCTPARNDLKLGTAVVLLILGSKGQRSRLKLGLGSGRRFTTPESAHNIPSC